MHRFRDMTTYWSKIAEKTYPTLIWHVPLGWPLANFSMKHTLPVTRVMGLSDCVHFMIRSCFRSARHNTGVWRTSRQTDRQTDRHVAVAKIRASIASRGQKPSILFCSWEIGTPSCLAGQQPWTRDSCDCGGGGISSSSSSSERERGWEQRLRPPSDSLYISDNTLSTLMNLNVDSSITV